MNDIFITEIYVKKVRNIENFSIPLSESERKHLIITGKNGSGKTSLLNEIDKFLRLTLSNPNFYQDNLDALNSTLQNLDNIRDLVQKKRQENNIKIFRDAIANFGGTTINLKNRNEITQNYLYVSFEAKRFVQSFEPKGITKIDFKERYESTERVNHNFLQYIVNLKAERSFAKDDNDIDTVKKIDDWFLNFENQLKNLFDSPDLHLIFDREKFNFNIKIGARESFDFSTLSDGYSAVISIISELILRMKAAGNKTYDQQGIVLIDEIETHLHVALQKKIMPFLCSFFPNIQFIVTTHSPFVLSSISNVVICDLAAKEVISELSGYSYDALVESYFETDKYSGILKEKLNRFEIISQKESLDESEKTEYFELKNYLGELPKFHANELAVKLQQIELQQITRKG